MQYDDKLYKVRQTIEKVLGNQPPSVDTAALYEEINDSEGGFIKDIIEGNFDWTYTPPAGTSAQPLRLGDFIEYKRNAINPIGQPPEMITAYKDINDYLTFNFDMAVAPNDRYNLTLQDIAIDGVTLDNYYLGMVLWKSLYDRVIAASDTKIGTGEITLKFKATGMLNEYSARLFASSVPIGPDGQMPSGKFVPLDLNMFKVKVNNYGTTVKIIPIGEWVGTTSVDCSVAVQNLNSGAVTVRDIVMVIVDGDRPGDGQTLKTIRLGDKRVGPNSVERITGNVSGLNYSSSKKYWVGAYADNIPITYNQIGL